MSATSETARLFAVLRRHLRREGWTAQKLAAHLGIGEATAKRRLAGKGITLERFGQLARLVGLTVAELAREAEGTNDGLARELTLAQERALSGDAFLAFIFVTILGENDPAEFIADYGVPADRMEAALQKLERLALIDRIKGGRIRSLVDHNVMYNKLPMRRAFETHMKQQFVAIDFSHPETVFASEVIKLSDAAAARLAEEIERHRREVHALAMRDRETALLKRTWYSVLWAARPLDLSRLQRAAGASSL